MYSLSLSVGSNPLRSSEIVQMILTLKPGHPDAMKHLTAIEELESRGSQHANHDFDVLSSAYDFATRRQTQADKNRETFSRLQVGESFTLHTLADNNLFCAGHFQKVGENRVSDWTDRRQWSSEDAGIFGEHLILSPATAYSVVPYIAD